jgi:DnaJ domain
VQPALAQAQKRISESLGSTAELTIVLDASGNPSSRVRARFVAQTGDGLKVRIATAIGDGVAVSVTGEIDTPAGREAIVGRYRVRNCKPAGLGTYHADIFPERPVHETSDDAASRDDELDYYEVLQVSRRADTDTIHRIFHILAQRYHPDNAATGNDELFRKVVAAHTVLTDPERRAALDVRLADEDKHRLQLFDSLESTQGVQAEIRKRQGVLRLLYTRRLTDPHTPTMRGRDFVEMLACPLEHLEFSLWFLRENRLIVRSDNNTFEITSRGVEAFEAEESHHAKKPVLKLPAPA